MKIDKKHFKDRHSYFSFINSTLLTSYVKQSFRNFLSEELPRPFHGLCVIRNYDLSKIDRESNSGYDENFFGKEISDFLTKYEISFRLDSLPLTGCTYTIIDDIDFVELISTIRVSSFASVDFLENMLLYTGTSFRLSEPYQIQAVYFAINHKSVWYEISNYYQDFHIKSVQQFEKILEKHNIKTDIDPIVLFDAYFFVYYF